MEKILKHLDLPQEALNVFYTIYDKISYTAEYEEITCMMKEMQPFKQICKKFVEYAEILNINVYEFSMTVLIANAYIAKERYVQKYADEQLFWNSLLDFKYKMNECKERYHVWGLEPVDWYLNFYEAKILLFGRLQFVETSVGNERLISVHIPSCGPLKHEDVMESYKRAYSFYPKTHGNLTAFVCNSYLLLPDYKGTVFKEGTNTYKFIMDYNILKVHYKDEFEDAWRIFYKDYNGDTSVLPQQTSMQRAFVQYLENGGKVGEASGVFMFDGETIDKDKAEILKEAFSE